MGNRVLVVMLAILFIGCGSGSSDSKVVLGDTVETNESIEETTTSENNTSSSIVTTDEELKALEEELVLLSSKLEDDSIAYTTEADFNKSLYAEEHLDDEEAQKLVESHKLVASAVDPDTEWFMTHVDKQVVLMEAGESYTVQLSKEDSNGTLIGPVDNDKLRLLVTVQRADNDFETFTSNVEPYVQWSGEGQLEITLPNDLEQGRLVIGIRPNFNDASTNAIAERWSTVMVAEVWGTKDNVIALENADLLFPLDAENSLSDESNFSKEEIAEVVSASLKEESHLVLPMVVVNKGLKEGDLVSYLFKEKPYSGRILSVVDKGTQQFIVLAPELFNVYHISEAENEFMIDEGLFPEHVIYREGDAFDENITLSKSSDGMVQKSAFFERECSLGGAGLTFSPKFSLYPLDASIDMAIYTTTNKVECKWKYSPKGLSNNVLLPFGGPLAIVAKLFGSEGEITPYGVASISAEGVPGLGVKAQYSVLDKKKRDVKILSMVDMASAGNREIDSESTAFTGKAEVANDMGVKLTLNAISPDGVIGWVFSQLNVSIEDVGVVSMAGGKVSLVATVNNAKEVYSSKKASNLALNVDVSGSVEPSNVFVTLAEDLGVVLKPLTVKERLFELKSEATYKFLALLDDGEGKASLSFLSPESDYLAALFANNTLGTLAPNDMDSSVFNDKAESITYNTAECASNAEYKIEVPAIACASWFCGDVNRNVKLCGDECKDSSRYTVVSHQNRNTKDWRVTVQDNENNLTYENVYPFNLEGSLYFIPTGEMVLASCGGEMINDSWEGQEEGEFWILDNSEKEIIKGVSNDYFNIYAHYQIHYNDYNARYVSDGKVYYNGDISFEQFIEESKLSRYAGVPDYTDYACHGRSGGGVSGIYGASDIGEMANQATSMIENVLQSGYWYMIKSNAYNTLLCKVGADGQSLSDIDRVEHVSTIHNPLFTDGTSTWAYASFRVYYKGVE